MRNRSYATLALAVLAFAGCSKVEEINCNPDSALQIESVGGVSQYALMQSKAVIDGNTLPGSEAAQGIGIFVTAQDGSAYDGHDKGYSNVKYTYNGEKWSTATPIYLSNTVGKLYGYFPYNAGATNLKAVPIASSLNGTDYLYAEQNEVSISEKSVNLQMNHALARLHLTLKKGEKYKAAGNISKITLKSTAIDASGTMDITTGEVSATKAKTDKGVVELAASGSLSTGDQTYDILLVSADASDVAKPFDIIISIDGATAGVTLSGDNALDIRSGIQCNATLEIQDTGIKITGVGIGAWGDGGGQTIEVQKHKVTVKLAQEQLPNLSNDIYLKINTVDDAKVVIEAVSLTQDKRFVCFLDGVADISTQTRQHSPFFGCTLTIYTFTISNITSDVTATIGYPRPTEINLNYSSFNLYAGNILQLSATVSPDDTYNKAFTWSSDNESVATVDNSGVVTAKSKGKATITATTVVGGKTASCDVTVSNLPDFALSGTFSISTSKKVNFSRGNLYWDGSAFRFESHQYAAPADYSQTHLGHFFWSNDYSVAISDTCDVTTSSGALFTNSPADASKANENFEVEGVRGAYRALTNYEWDYLLFKRKMMYVGFNYTTGIQFGGKTGVVLYPDDYKGSALDKSIEYTDVTFPDGCVFLPGAGKRLGTRISTSFSLGFYWDSNLYNSERAFTIRFTEVSVDTPDKKIYDEGYSIRLVTGVGQ